MGIFPLSEILLQASCVRSITSPLIAWSTASRSEPAPESSQFPTARIVLSGSGKAIASLRVEAASELAARTAARHAGSDFVRSARRPDLQERTIEVILVGKSHRGACVRARVIRCAPYGESARDRTACERDPTNAKVLPPMR